MHRDSLTVKILPPVKDAIPRDIRTPTRVWDSGLAAALKALEPYESKKQKPKRGRGQKEAHGRGVEAAFAGGQSLPHATITKQMVYEPPAVLSSVPESMYLHVAAPYTSTLPGSKVKPGPGNLGAFAAAARAHVGTGTNTTSSTSQRKQHSTANKPHHASPPKSQLEGDHLLRAVSQDAPHPSPTLSSTVMVGYIAHQSSSIVGGGSPGSHPPSRLGRAAASPPAAGGQGGLSSPGGLHAQAGALVSQAVAGPALSPAHSMSPRGFRPTVQSDGAMWASTSSLGAAGSGGLGLGAPVNLSNYWPGNAPSNAPAVGSSGGWVFSSTMLPTKNPSPLKPGDRGSGSLRATYPATGPALHSQPSFPARYPHFVYAYTPLAKPLPVANSPVLRDGRQQHPHSRHPHHYYNNQLQQQHLHQYRPGPSPPPSSLGSVVEVLGAATGRITKGPSFHHPHHPHHHHHQKNSARAILDHLVPSEVPSVMPGHGLFSHAAGPQSPKSGGTLVTPMLATLPEDRSAHHLPPPPSPLPTNPHSHHNVDAAATIAAPYTLGSASTPVPFSASSDMVSSIAHMVQSTTVIERPPSPNRLYHLPPSSLQNSRQQESLFRLTHDLDQVVDGVKADMQVPIPPEALVLKTNQLHHKTGPLRTLDPQRHLASLMPPKPSEVPTTSPPPLPRPRSPVMTALPGAGMGSLRTPMFARRSQATGFMGGLEEGAGAAKVHPTPGSHTLSQAASPRNPPAPADADAGSRRASEMVSRLPANVAVDISEVAAAAEEAQAAQVEAAAAAAVAAAVLLPSVASTGSRPPTRQGLAEAVAAVGAGLASAVAQIPVQTPARGAAAQPPNLPKPPAPKPAPPQVLVVGEENSSSTTFTNNNSDFQVHHAAPMPATAAAPPKVDPAPLEPATPSESPRTQPVASTEQEPRSVSQLTQAMNARRLSSMRSAASSVGGTLDAILDDLVDSIGERPPWPTYWQRQYHGQDSINGGSSIPEYPAPPATAPAAIPPARPHSPMAPPVPAPSATACVSSEGVSPCKPPPLPASGVRLPFPSLSLRTAATEPMLPESVLKMASEAAHFDEDAEEALMQAAAEKQRQQYERQQVSPMSLSSTRNDPHHPLSAPGALMRNVSSGGSRSSGAGPFSMSRAGVNVARYRGDLNISGIDDEGGDGDIEYVDIEGSDPLRSSDGYEEGAYGGRGDYENEDDEDLDFEPLEDDESVGHTTSRADAYSGISIVRPYPSEAGVSFGGGDQEFIGSEDGEQLSVSAYGFGPVQPLSMSFGRNARHDSSLRSNTENDVTLEDGIRLLGRRYEVLHVVGEGAYGMVMKCRMRGAPAGQEWVAVKEFKIEDGDPDAEDVKRTSRREVAVLQALQHPNVVRFVDQFMVRDRLFIVMEFVPCNLLELLEAQPGGMDREAVRLILYQLCTAIAFIHAQSVVYRDIKPENVLVDERGRIKLCDFGFARFVKGTPGEHLTDYVATRWYRAPELLLGPPYREGPQYFAPVYGPPVDMWAIGCLMGELLDGEPLFAGDSDLDQLYRIQQVVGPVTGAQAAQFAANPHNAGITFNFKEPLTLAARYHDHMNEVELDFLSRLLTLDPDTRMTGSQALRHPYLADLAAADQPPPSPPTSSVPSTATGGVGGAGSSPRWRPLDEVLSGRDGEGEEEVDGVPRARAGLSGRAWGVAGSTSGAALRAMGSLAQSQGASRRSTRHPSPITCHTDGAGPGSYEHGLVPWPSSPTVIEAVGEDGNQGDGEGEPKPDDGGLPALLGDLPGMRKPPGDGSARGRGSARVGGRVVGGGGEDGSPGRISGPEVGVGGGSSPSRVSSRLVHALAHDSV